jgi:hypothetical protein
MHFSILNDRTEGGRRKPWVLEQKFRWLLFFWALVIVVFAFAFLISEAIAYLERRVEHYAGAR